MRAERRVPGGRLREPAGARRSVRVRSAVVLVALAVLPACQHPAGLSPSDDRVQVVTTTGILRDLVANVGGDRVRVSSLIPDGADPHSYEPSLRRVRDVVYADVAFSNYLLLEPQAVIRTLDVNLPERALNVSIAEEAVAYAADLLPLVETPQLDALWLGVRVVGDGRALGADRTSEVLVSIVDVDGPGGVVGFITGSFGQPEVVFDSRDGFEPGDGFRADTMTLPTAAHSHMSWAFTEPGVYRLRVRSSLRLSATDRPRRIAEGTVTFAVGVDPSTAGQGPSPEVLDTGHTDLTVDITQATVVLTQDPDPASGGQRRQLALASTVVAVPNRTRVEVPADPAYRFLGSAGERIFQLPQAVLGRHVHGEIDPHLWHDVDNAAAYVRIIRDTLSRADPAGAADYRRRAEEYLRRLERLDVEIDRELAAIPPSRRHLVTTHDAFRYLARDRDFDVAGFVTPNPATEPSLADRRRLVETIRNLRVPAVFLEPNLISRSSMLLDVARDEGVDVCPLRGDTFDREVHTYIELMRANARSLRRCLAP